MSSGGSWGFFSTKFSSKRRSCFHVSHPPCNYLHTSARQAACFMKRALPLGELCGALPAFGASSGFLYCFTNRAHKGGLEGEKTRRCRAGVPVWTSGLGEGSWGEKGVKHQGFFLEPWCRDALFYFQTSTRHSLAVEANMPISTRRMRPASSWWTQPGRRKQRTRGIA